jgi:hypothetical protein
MTTNLHLYAHLVNNSHVALLIFIAAKKDFNETLQREIKRVFYVRYTFHINLNISR